MASCLRVSPRRHRKRRKDVSRHSHIKYDVGVVRTLRPNRVGRLQFFVSISAPWRLCGRFWVGGDGAFAPEAWVPSARRPYPIFSIRVDLRDSRACSKTAEDCRCCNAPSLCPRASVRNPCFSTRLRPLPFRGFVPSFEPMRVWEPRSARACFRRGVGRRGGGRGGTLGGRMGGGSGSCRGGSF